MNYKIINYYPKISIITCVYNGEKYISKLLDSVLNMGYPNIEHIIVNDGSIDSTETIVMEYADYYRNKSNSNLFIKYIKQENMGLGGATNTGLKAVTGDYWTWINCDDWYEKEAFNRTIKKFRKNVDIVFMNQNCCTIKDGIMQQQPRVNKQNYYGYASSNKHIKKTYQRDIYQLHYLVKTESFDSINPSRTIDPLRYTQDVQLSCTLFPNMKSKLEPSVCTTFLYREDSLFFSDRQPYKVYLESALRSFDYVNIKNKIKESQKSLFIANYYYDDLAKLVLYQTREEFQTFYVNKYKPLTKNIITCHKKYLFRRWPLIYFLSHFPVIYSLLFKR